MNPSPLVKLTRTRKLVIMSDIHVGAEEFEEAAFLEALRWVKDHEALVYFAGDLCDNAIASGKDAGEKLMGQKWWPTEQAKWFIDRVKPLAKAGRVAGILRGNHDARTRRESLFDICDLIAHSLEVRYDGHGVASRWLAGKELYTLGIHHGSTAAKNIWLELKRMLDLYAHADLVAAGHNHAFAAEPMPHITVDAHGHERRGVRWMVRTGCFLGYAEYLRPLCLPPSATGCPIIGFGDSKHELEVDVQTLRWNR